MYIENPRFPKIFPYCNASENGLLSACLPLLLLNDLSPLPKGMAILDFLRELLKTSFLYGTGKAMTCFHWSISSVWHRWSYHRSKQGPISCYLRYMSWAKTLCNDVSPSSNQQVRILPLQNGCMTEVISDWQLSCHFSQLLVTLPSTFFLLQNFIS